MFEKLIHMAFVLFFTTFIVCIFTADTHAQICQPVTNGLVSWYRAEGNAADWQGANNGALKNGAAFAAGKIGQAFRFDGTDDLVEIPDAASLKLQHVTVEAWVKFDSLFGATSGGAPNGFQYIVHKKNARNTDHFEGYSLIKLSNHQFAFSISRNNGAQTTIVDNTQTIVTGQFYHVIGSYDGTTARLYINGQKVSEAVHNAALEYDTRPVFIGASGETAWDGKMNGLIDEVRIYNRALTDSEASANYNAGASLIVNCDAEADQTATGGGSTNHDVFGWENETGEFTVVRYASTGGSFPTATDAGPANRGNFFFAGGQTAASSASQIVSVAAAAARIDAGNQGYELNGYLGGFSNQADNARLTAAFRDAANNVLGSAIIGPVTVADRGGATGLLPRTASGIVPAGTRTIEITLLMTRSEGTYNDGYADNLSFKLTEPNAASSEPVSWYGGDGDARDFENRNNGTLINNPTFVVGKVGQAFRFQNGSHVQINSSGIFRGQTEGTIETWVRPRGLATGFYNSAAIWTESEASRNFTRLGLYYSNTGRVGVYANNSTVNAVSPSPVPLNEWTHVAGTYKSGEGSKLYVNGVLAASSSNSAEALSNDLGAFIGIGALLSAAGDDFRFNGDVDEASVYTRALSANEIQAIFNRGTAGKARSVTTNAGSNFSSLLRDATLTFASITAAGETEQTPLETAALPALPQNFAHTGLAYNIQTTAGFSGNIDVCFNLPALADAKFPRVRILQLVEGNWIDRTTNGSSPILCGRATSLSTFAIAENLLPTAALVSIGGRVANPNGRGIYGVRIILTDSAGETRTTSTNAFGYYRFADVQAGASYVLSAASKRFVFAPENLVLNVGEEQTDANFTALQ